MNNNATALSLRPVTAQQRSSLLVRLLWPSLTLIIIGAIFWLGRHKPVIA